MIDDIQLCPNLKYDCNKTSLSCSESYLFGRYDMKFKKMTRGSWKLVIYQSQILVIIKVIHPKYSKH